MHTSTLSQMQLNPTEAITSSVEHDQRQRFHGDERSCQYLMDLQEVSVFVLVLASVGIILNVLVSAVIILLLREKEVKQKPTYYFLLNLSLSDCGWCSITLYIGCIKLFPHLDVLPRCIRQGLAASLITAPGVFLFLKTLDCYLYITHGLTYHDKISSTKAKLACTLSWILLFGMSFFLSIGLYIRDSTLPIRCIGWFNLAGQLWYKLLYFLVLFLPFLGICVLHGFLVHHTLKFLKRKEKMQRVLAEKGNTSDPMSRLRQFLTSSVFRSVRGNLLLCASFCVTWLPSTVMLVLILVSPTAKASCTVIALYNVATFLTMLNPLIDPFLYVWNYNDLRKKVMQIWEKTLRIKKLQSMSSNTKVSDSEITRL